MNKKFCWPLDIFMYHYILWSCNGISLMSFPLTWSRSHRAFLFWCVDFSPPAKYLVVDPGMPCVQCRTISSSSMGVSLRIRSLLVSTDLPFPCLSLCTEVQPQGKISACTITFNLLSAPVCKPHPLSILKMKTFFHTWTSSWRRCFLQSCIIDSFIPKFCLGWITFFNG